MHGKDNVRVEIKAAAFHAEHCEDSVLIGILAMALLGRHRVFIEDPSILDEWEPTQDPQSLLRSEIDLALELSLSAEATAPPTLHEIIVDDVQAPSWGLSCTLSPRHALSFLARPLRILLENGRNDGNFILAFCSRSTRTRLEDAVREGWVDFANAGGITSLAHILGSEDRLDILLRTFVVCDSDAQAKGSPSSDALKVDRLIAEKAAALAAQPEQFGHVLTARAAENYADCTALVRWASDQVPPAEREQFLRNRSSPRTSSMRKSARKTAIGCSAARWRGELSTRTNDGISTPSTG
jgi:hypothetical protein